MDKIQSLVEKVAACTKHTKQELYNLGRQAYETGAEVAEKAGQAFKEATQVLGEFAANPYFLTVVIGILVGIILACILQFTKMDKKIAEKITDLKCQYADSLRNPFNSARQPLPSSTSAARSQLIAQ